MSHTYRIQHVENGQWSVLDSDDAPVFCGTLRECEDWLDRRENVERERISLLRRLWRRLRRPFRPDSDDSPQGPHPAPLDSAPDRAEQAIPARPSDEAVDVPPDGESGRA